MTTEKNIHPSVDKTDEGDQAKKEIPINLAEPILSTKDVAELVGTTTNAVNQIVFERIVSPYNDSKTARGGSYRKTYTFEMLTRVFQAVCVRNEFGKGGSWGDVRRSMRPVSEQKYFATDEWKQVLERIKARGYDISALSAYTPQSSS